MNETDHGLSMDDIERQAIVKGDVTLPEGGVWAIKKDAFSRVRGGNSEMLLIGCGNCQSPLLIYQKDGPGPLKRCYIDRIAYVWGGDGNRSPDPIESLHESGLNCPHCRQIIGSPMVYKNEKRPAVKMSRGSFSKTKYSK